MVEEKPKRALVHLVVFGKGERFSHEAPDALAQRVVPAFEMISRPALFAAPMLCGRYHLRVGRPEVGETQLAFVGLWNTLSQQTTGRFAATA